jgi:hypothetical protein
MVKYSSWANGNVALSNTGDEVLLLDGSDSVVDVVAYGNSPYPAFQPPVPTVSEGHSIERRPANVDTDTNADWHDQPSPAPGVVSLLP